MSALTNADKKMLAIALVNAGVSFLIAVFLTILLSLTPAHRFGSDLTQKIYLVLGVPGGALGAAGSDRDPSGNAPVRKWVFVDLGGRFCKAPGTARCPPEAPWTDRKALARIIAAVRASKPRVVILDVVSAPHDGGEDEALKAALRVPGSPVILTWMPGKRPGVAGGRVTLSVRRDEFLCEVPRCADLPTVRYLPALATRSGSTARMLGSRYRLYDDYGNSWDSPGAGLGAAMVAASPADAPWSRIDAFARRGSAGPASLKDCVLADSERCLHAYAATERVFSFLPVRPGADLPAPPTDDGFLHLIPDDPPARLTQLRDSVVVIGDSRREAGDRWWTAAGDTAGAEIILNDARQFLVAPPAGGRSLPAYLLAKLPFLLSGFAVLLAFNLALAWRRIARPRPPTLRPPLIAGMRALARLVVVAGVTALLFLIMIWWGDFRKPGMPPDIVTPFVGLIAESCFEALHQFATAIHASADKALARRWSGSSEGESS